ncbi:hypothetical protein VaNZ11_015104, partial [Volvox africanus]
MMEEDIGLAELGVTARNAALVEAEILQESLSAAGDGSGDGVARTVDTGPSDGVYPDLRADDRASAAGTADPAPAATRVGGGDDASAAATIKDSGRRERRQWAAELLTVETEIATLEKALEVATEVVGGARSEEVVEAVDGGSGLHPLHLRESLSLQVALLRDRLAGLREERERLQGRLAIEYHGTQQQQQQQQESGSGAAMSPTQPSRRLRFGARALARVGAGCGDTRGGAAAATDAAAADRSADADGNPQTKPQNHQMEANGVASKKARTATVLDDAQDDPLAAATVSGSGGGSGGDGGGGGPGGMALAETEKDRLIRCGFLTPFDRLTGFERKMQNMPPAAAAAASIAAVAVAAPPPRSRPPPLQPPRYQAAGYGNLRHLGRAELRPDEAMALTRSGRSVGEVIAAAGRAALEARSSRRAAQFLEPQELPQQERGVRRVPQHFWRQAASGRTAGSNTRLRRKRTLPQANRGSARRARRVAAAAAAVVTLTGPGGSVTEAAAAATGREENERKGSGSGSGRRKKRR